MAVDWSGGLFPIANKQSAPILAADYDTAKTTRLTERHWAIGEQLADPSDQQRRTLRNRSRYEVSNNSLLQGMIETYSRDMVGSGPHPTFREFGQRRKAIRDRWDFWCQSIELASTLQTFARAYLTDGELFLIATTEPPYFRAIEPERIWKLSPDQDTLEGITYVDGVPITYWVDGKDPFPADVVSHLYKKDLPNQRRGVPRAAPSLDMFAFIRRLNISAVASYETVAKLALVLQAKMLTPTRVSNPFEVVDLVAGSAITLPEGYELGQVRAEHPNSSHREIVSLFVGEAARCFPMPLNKALGTSQDSNFASGSLDNIDYERAIANDQRLFEDRLITTVVSIFLMLEQLEAPNQRLFVGYDAIPHLNPEKQFGAIQTKLEMRLTSRTREAARLGENWEDIQEELEREESRLGAGQPSREEIPNNETQVSRNDTLQRGVDSSNGRTDASGGPVNEQP